MNDRFSELTTASLIEKNGSPSKCLSVLASLSQSFSTSNRFDHFDLFSCISVLPKSVVDRLFPTIIN